MPDDTLAAMPTDVDAGALKRLLALQDEDTAIKRLEIRRASLPEAQRLVELNDQLVELTTDLEIATKQLDEIAREQSRIEGEMGLLEQKIEREEQRLFSGAVSNPKELAALQSEVAMLKRRRSEHEDALLEVMVQRDQASDMATKLTSEHHALSQRVEELRAAVATLTGDIDSELTQHRAERDAILPDIPEGLLTLYERVREHKGGVGAAALVGGMCQGCHTKLPAKEVERLRSEGGVQRCDNCRRILIVI